ncbi:MAG: hypothetical protein E7635_02530 [Ruminococcaceae bacterium]|nr:hypothetical protein [Oscillospiraceae bacterium]
MSNKKPKLTKEEKDLLKGHRERLRKRYITQDKDYMNDARLLELLLTYSIPVQDVYPISVKLLAKFGDIENVLSASIDELCTVNGIGSSTAILINMHAALNRRCVIAQNSRKTFNDTTALAKKICELYFGVRGEKLMILTFNASMQLLNYEWLSSEHPSECSFDQRELSKILLRDDVAKVAIAHNHPNGDVAPSREDIRAAMELNRIITSMSVELVDIFIVSGYKYFKLSDSVRFVGDFKANDDSLYSSVFDEDEDSVIHPDFAETIIKKELEK